MKGQKRDFGTTIPGVLVHATWPPFKGRKITISAYPIDAETGIRLAGSKVAKITANSAEEIPHKQQILISRVVKALQKTTEKKTHTIAGERTAMEAALDYIEKNRIKVKPTWGEDYQRSKIINFRRHILPRIIELGEDIAEFSVAELERELVEEVLKSGHSIGHEGTAAATVKKKLLVAATIYARMRDVDPTLPELNFIPPFGGRRAQLEQMKSLLPPVRDKLVDWIESYIDFDPRLAAAAAQMFDCGLRTAEASATHPEQLLRDNGTIVGIYVFFQEKNGERVPTLKSENSYRAVPVSEWGSTILSRCFDAMGSLEEKEPLCDSRKLSAMLRQVLKGCGVDEEYLLQAERDMRRVPDYDEKGNPCLDATAYVLRRDWATRARTLCGFTTEELDYCLGHAVKKPKGQTTEQKSPEELKKLAGKLENFIADLRYSAHPAVKPFDVVHGTDIDFMPYGIVRVRNDSEEPLRIEVDLINAMVAESFTAIMPIGSCGEWKKRCVSTRGIRPQGIPLFSPQEKLELKEDGTIESKENGDKKD